MPAWVFAGPHVRRDVNENLDDPGVGSALIVRKAKAPLKALAGSVGSDIVSRR